MFSLEESLKLLLRRPEIAKALSYDHVPDCTDFNMV